MLLFAFDTDSSTPSHLGGCTTSNIIIRIIDLGYMCKGVFPCIHGKNVHSKFAHLLVTAPCVSSYPEYCLKGHHCDGLQIALWRALVQGHMYE